VALGLCNDRRGPGHSARRPSCSSYEKWNDQVVAAISAGGMAPVTSEAVIRDERREGCEFPRK